MITRRLLGEMLEEVASDAMDALSIAPELRINQIAVTLPVEMQLRWAGSQVQILGDLPRLVTRTSFDVRPGRIEVVWEAKDSS